MRARFTTFLLLLTLGLFCSLDASAQVGLKRLFSHNNEKGTMYFIGQKKLTKLENIKKFEFDITYLDYTDSATVNFTVISPNPTDVSELKMGNSSIAMTATDVELLYHEVKGKNYVVRTTSKVPFQTLKEIVKSESPMVFDIVHTDGQKGKATYSASQWKKERDLLGRILYLINK